MQRSVLSSLAFSTLAVGDIPVSIAKAGGDAQIALPGTAVVVPPAVSVTDAPGQPSAWRERAVRGDIWGRRSPRVVGDNRRQRPGLVRSVDAGKRTGIQRVDGIRAGLGSVVFSASAAVPTYVYIALGDGQWAPPGTDVPMAPTVIVASVGSGVSGVPVQFTVTSGGGTVRTATATTDANGRASCGAWTLGPSKDVNRLSASVLGLSSVSFVAYADCDHHNHGSCRNKDLCRSNHVRGRFLPSWHTPR